MSWPSLYILDSCTVKSMGYTWTSWQRRNFVLMMNACVNALSLAKAEDDYNAPDCRFINIKKGDLVFVYSKLIKQEDGGEFWAGSVYSDQYRDQMGHVGYFPSSLVTELHVYQDLTQELPTTDIDFYCD
uniref:Otoraplin n=1 Tax=Xenopus tropicalis TaxID=8364 RepID=F6TZE9_XENTR